MPAVLCNALLGVFDQVFALFEKVSPQLRGFANHFKWSFGVSKPHELLEAWQPFNIKALAGQIHCPLLILIGEGEYEQTDAKTAASILRFISELTCPVAVHEFAYKEGWAASHCSVGDEGPANMVIFDWLERTVINPNRSQKTNSRREWSLLTKYHHNRQINELLQNIQVADA